MIMDRRRRLVVIAVIFVTFNALAFVIPFYRDSAFWTAYVFSITTILAMLVADWVAFRNADSLKRVFMGIPIMKIAYTCLTAQLAVCIGFMVAATFIPVPAWRVFVPGLLILASGTVAIFKADWGREVIEQIEERNLANTEFMMGFRVDLEALVPRMTDTVLKSKIESLAKAAKRSDPVSSDGLFEIEAEIGRKFELLKYSALNDISDSTVLADELSHLLNERNLKCRQLKRHQQ